MTDPQPPVRLSPGAVVLFAIWFGVLTGLGELALLAWDKLAGKLIFVPRQVVWMAPLANVLYCAAVGVVLVLAGGGKPALRTVVFAFATIALAAWLFMFGFLHPIANVVLAGGGALQLSRAVSKHEVGFARMVRRTSAVLGALLLAAFIGTWAWRSWGESSQIAKLPEARAGSKNVLVITLDTVRAKSLGLCGYERPTTPKLEAFAERGVLFDHAIATAPWTLPSHAGLFTGRFHHELSVNWDTGLDDTYPTLAEELAGHGYATAAFTANLNYCSYEVGLARGFAHFDDYPNTPGQIVLASSLGRAVTNSAMLRDALQWHENLNRKFAADINDAFLGWIDNRPERPFFGFLNFYDAHQPYLPPGEFEGKFGKVVPRTGFRYDTNLIEIEEWNKLTPEQIQCEHDSYDGAIAYLDDQLGQLFDALEQRGILKDTLVVLTSDHGEQFGEHQLYNHGNSLYLPAVRIPLLVALPGRVPERARVTTPISLRDVPATILDLVGLSDGSQLPGQSLAHYWDDTVKDAEPDIILTECLIIEGTRRRGESKSLIAGNLHFIVNGDGSEELYDISDDLAELRNRRASPDGRATAADFRKILDSILGFEWKPEKAK